MALKHYIATSLDPAASDLPETQPMYEIDGVDYPVVMVFDTASGAVAAGYELAIVNTRITGGAHGGTLYLLAYREGSVMTVSKFTVAADDVVYLDGKEFYEAGDALGITASAAGISVEMFGSYDPVG